MPRKYNREQKEDAIKLLQDCEWTKTEHKKIEQTLYNKFRYERDEDKKRKGKKRKMQFKNYKEFITEYVNKITEQKGKCFYCGLTNESII